MQLGTGRPGFAGNGLLAAAGVRPCAGLGLWRAREEADGPDGIRGPPEARWCHGFEQRGSGQEGYAAMADGGARECGRGCYGMGTSKTKEGKRSEAHSEFVGGLGELGEASEAANRQRRSSVAEEGKSVGAAPRG